VTGRSILGITLADRGSAPLDRKARLDLLGLAPRANPGRRIAQLDEALGRCTDAPRSSTPDVHIFTRSKLGWITLPDGVPAFEVYYETNALWPAASLDRLRAILAPADDGT
jgi:hypothetical protein